MDIATTRQKHGTAPFGGQCVADISIIPPKHKNIIPSSDYKLYAANGTEIVTYGTKVRSLDIGLRRQFQWPFVIANTNRDIIGANFLDKFGLMNDI
ncbi:hypothetical protein LAZ67_21002005 [Cordylochernes scorpioides]|uniref:Peptidase A1 domain-containing protein n=1 Tax=Cordylochernes scorpioides TaxID=51811 RepID=A0ABY6LMY0_9ARAC|nr:hypothetical protein LAZ67_21002005 [Cordylochernes scorpioides]